MKPRDHAGTRKGLTNVCVVVVVVGDERHNGLPEMCHMAIRWVDPRAIP